MNEFEEVEGEISKEEKEEKEEQPLIFHDEQSEGEAPKGKDFIFKRLKEFGGKYNTAEIHKLINSEKYLLQIVELVVDSIEDNDLFDFVKPLYPNLRPIRTKLDRQVVIKMLLQGSSEYLVAAGKSLVSNWLDNASLGVIYKNNTDDLVGAFSAIHRNSLCCDILIHLRGENDRERARVAAEMVAYWGSRYARQLWEQGYKYALAVTLNEKHAALVKNIRKKEYTIICNQLKETSGELSESELLAKAKELTPGFKNTGTIMARQFEGAQVWEFNWRYDLIQKFGEHIQQQ